MQKRIPIYHYICFGFAIATLFLPYLLHSSSYLDSPLLPDYAKKYIYESGFDLIEITFVPLLAILIISAIVLAYRSKATAIVGIVLSFFLILFMILLGVALTFTLFGISTKKVGIGYVLQFLNVITYFVLNIYFFAWIRKNKIIPKKDLAELDLLDDSDILENL